MSGESEQTDLSHRVHLLRLVVDQLSCPACYSQLRMDGSQLACTGCGRVYPIIDGIPKLIAEQVDRS